MSWEQGSGGKVAKATSPHALPSVGGEILSRQEGRNGFRGFRPPARIFFQALKDCPLQGRLNFGTQHRRWNQCWSGLEAVGRYAVKRFLSRGHFIQHKPKRIEVALFRGLLVVKQTGGHESGRPGQWNLAAGSGNESRYAKIRDMNMTVSVHHDIRRL